MISRYEAWMDDTALSSIHSELYVRDIVQEAVQLQGTASRLAKGYGMYLTNRVREALRVTIEFELHIYDPAMRQAVCQEVAEWANGRVLKTSDRRGQELHVVCDYPPYLPSAMRWTDTLSMAFTAYETPFWTADTPKSITANNTSVTAFIPGNVPQDVARAKVDAVITAGSALTSATVTCGGKSIELSGISVASGGTIVFSHDENGILSIMSGSTSLLNKRTAASADDLTVPVGAISTFTSNRNCTFTVRGLWL